MATTSPAERLAREISDLRRRISGLERSAATDLRSIDGGSFTAYDDDGLEVVLLGRRPDGSWGVEGVNGGTIVADEARENAITAAAILDGAVTPEKASFYGEVEQAATDAAQASTDAGTALQEASEAKALADGKVQTFFGTTDPSTDPETTLGEGDLWIDQGNGNVLKRWNGATWDTVQDEDVQTALQNAADAEAAADGKITTFYGSTEPVAEADGDLWVDPSRGNLVSRWDATIPDWIALTVDTGAIAPAAITETEILDGSITSPKLEANLVLTSRLIAGDPIGARVEQNSTGLFAYRSDGVETFGVDAQTGLVHVTGDLLTAPYGQPRVELTDYTTGGESGTGGASQIRMIPGENVVTGWNTAEPGFVTVWSNTASGNDGFSMEIVTPDPTNYERARIRLTSSDVGYANPAITTYGELWVYDDFTSPLRLFSVTRDLCYVDSDEFYLNTRYSDSYMRATNAEFIWQSGGSDWLWAANDRLEFKVNNDPLQQRLLVQSDAIELQSNDLFYGGAHRACVVGNGAHVFVGYENNAGNNHHGMNALEGGSLRLQSRSADPAVEILSGSAGSWRNIWASAFEVHSDKATKTNLRAPEASALGAVRDAPVYAYDYKSEFSEDDPNRFGRLGPLADDLPEGIARTPEYDSGYEEPLKVVSLNQMIGLLWQAVQELDEELDEIRQQKPKRKARDFSEKPLPARKTNPTKKEITRDAPEPVRPEGSRYDRATGPGRRG